MLSKNTSFGLAAIVVISLIYYLQDDSTTPKTARTVSRSKPNAANALAPEFLPEDFETSFESAGPVKRNLFKNPLADKKPEAARGGDSLEKVPQDLAGGDGNWIFTGVATLDGKKMALLENPTSHQGDYVTEGVVWKAAKIRRISTDGVALAPKAGGEELVVYRHKPALVADASAGAQGAATLPPTGPPQPLMPQQLSGPIGNGMIIRRSRRGAPMFIENGAGG